MTEPQSAYGVASAEDMGGPSVQEDEQQDVDSKSFHSSGSVPVQTSTRRRHGSAVHPLAPSAPFYSDMTNGSLTAAQAYGYSSTDSPDCGYYDQECTEVIQPSSAHIRSPSMAPIGSVQVQTALTSPACLADFPPFLHHLPAGSHPSAMQQLAVPFTGPPTDQLSPEHNGTSPGQVHPPATFCLVKVCNFIHLAPNLKRIVNLIEND